MGHKFKARRIGNLLEEKLQPLGMTLIELVEPKTDNDVYTYKFSTFNGHECGISITIFELEETGVPIPTIVHSFSHRLIEAVMKGLDE